MMKADMITMTAARIMNGCNLASQLKQSHA